jgi:acyl carrier protein
MSEMTELTEEVFYARFRAFLHEHRPDLPADVDPSTQLWDAGYLDSFALIETLTLLEELTGHPIEIGADDLPSFFTMRAIYEAFVAGEGAAAAPGTGVATA